MKLKLGQHGVEKINFTLVSCMITLVLLIGLSWGVMSGAVNAWDETFLQWVRHFHEPGLFEFARVFYFLGEAEVAVFIVLAALIFFCWKRYWKEAEVLAISALSILILQDQILKPFFGRIRPAPGLIDVHGKSYPSGHVSGNLMLYFYFSYILSYYFPEKATYFYAISAIISFLTGWSSLYLHIHWATDVIAGFGVGYLAFTLAIILLKRVDRKYQKY